MNDSGKDPSDGSISCTEGIVRVLSSLSEKDWEKADYPLISFADKGVFQSLVDNKYGSRDNFWKQILSPVRFFCKDSDLDFDSGKHTLFIIHGDRNSSGSDFIAVTTSIDSLLKNPNHMINFDYHGKPCENSSKEKYPRVSFWKFYDRLTDADKDKYPIPDLNFRRNFINKNI